jgi:hypothetical protein
MDIFAIILISLLLFVGMALTTIFIEAKRSGAMIDKWAYDYGFEVLTKKQPLLNLGPFRWENPHGRTFYLIEVRDGNGTEYTAWICCGAMYLGLFSNKVEVRWISGEPSRD